MARAHQQLNAVGVHGVGDEQRVHPLAPTVDEPLSISHFTPSSRCVSVDVVVVVGFS
jgi:hypothetical protein